MNYAVKQRLRMIDFLLAQYGTVSLSALEDYFGISHPQASRDFKAYLERAPGNMVLAPSKKYIKTDTFKRAFE